MRSSPASARAAACGQAGQGMVEYALILIMVAVAVVLVLITMGSQVRNLFSNVVQAIGT